MGANKFPEGLSKLETTLLGILRQGSATFQDILGRAGNADPRVVKDCLHELAKHQIVQLRDDSYYVNTLKLHELNITLLPKPKPDHILRKAQEVLTYLPVEAPVYSQWWFPSDVIRNVLELILTQHPTAKTFCFVGAPSLAATFAALVEAEITIVDIDPKVCGSIQEAQNMFRASFVQIVNEDVTTYIPENFYDVVYSDPPWDFNSLESFITKCPSFVCSGGHFYISYPGNSTRPGIEVEKLYLAKLLSSNDMALVSYYTGFLTYNVPEFELSAYSDIPGFTKDPWRQGDLATYQRCSTDALAKVEERIKRPLARKSWNEFAIGQRRVFLRINEQDKFHLVTPSILPIYPSATKPSVSSRDLELETVGLWTSRNEAFSTSGNHIIAYVLMNFERGVLDFEKIVISVANALYQPKERVDTILRGLCSQLRTILEI